MAPFSLLLQFVVLSSPLRSSLRVRTQCIDMNVPSQINCTTQAAFRFQLRVQNLDQGSWGLVSRDNAYAIQIIQLDDVPLPLGISLTEELVFGPGGDLRTIALVEKSLQGGGAATCGLQPGDAIILVGRKATESKPATAERVEGLDIDSMTDTVSRMGSECECLTLTLKRLVPRALVRVRVFQPDGQEIADFDSLAGSNLRNELLKKNVQLYDERTKRFDNPWGKQYLLHQRPCPPPNNPYSNHLALF